MNLKFTLFKLIPLITFITVLFPTTNIAKAASSSPAQEIAPSEAILKDDGHAGDHGEYHAAAGGHNKSSNGKNKIVLSEEAIQIKFFIFSGMLFLGVFAPEILYNSKKDNELLDSEEHQDTHPEPAKVTVTKTAKVKEPDLDFLKVISEKAKDVDSFFEPAESNGTGKKSKSQKST